VLAGTTRSTPSTAASDGDNLNHVITVAGAEDRPNIVDALVAAFVKTGIFRDHVEIRGAAPSWV